MKTTQNKGDASVVLSEFQQIDVVYDLAKTQRCPVF